MDGSPPISYIDKHSVHSPAVMLPPRDPPASTSPPSPSQIDFSFPTLHSDGSIPDLTDLTSHQQLLPRARTPPAALSTLGARASMENQETASESGASFADSQYDMLDDMSEISTDDHETASITSHDDGAFTPEQTASDVETDGHTLDFEPRSSDTTVNLIGSSSDSSTHPTQTKVENDPTDSYMSDDLETPRQSIVTPVMVKKHANHILFFSDKSVSRQVKDSICGKVAACMSPSKEGESARWDVVRLPTTPTGICPPSAVVNGKSRVVATVQCCVGAEKIQGGYKLRVLDIDEEHTSFFTIGQHSKIDLTKPQIAVFYIDESAHAQEWTDAAYAAMHSIHVPVLVVLDPPAHSTSAVHTSNKIDLSLNADEFKQMDHPELRQCITALMDLSTTSMPKSKRHIVKRSGKANSFTFLPNVLKSFTSLTHVLLIAVMALSIYQFSTIMMTKPEAKLALRRESLAMVLESVTGSVNATKDYNIDYLLPSPPTHCASNGLAALVSRLPVCKPTSRFQVDGANRFIISVEPVPSGFRWLNVSHPDGQLISFRHTELISGVYEVIIIGNDAYGIVSVNMVTNYPYNVIVASHNFGKLMLPGHLKKFEKATTDVSKVVSKDVAVFRDAAKSLSSKLQSELGAGYSATKNVTSLLAVSMTRELQVVAAKAAKASNQTLTAITKELIVARKSIVQFPRDVKSRAKKTAISILKAPAPRIQRARDNLELIKFLIRRPFQKKKTIPPVKSPKNSMLTDLSTTVKDASDQIRRDIKRMSKSLGPKEYTPSNALQSAKHELAETNKQLSAARQSLIEGIRGPVMKGHVKKIKALKKDVKEQEVKVKKCKEDMHRLERKV